jgi:glycogen debranching enzyme
MAGAFAEDEPLPPLLDGERIVSVTEVPRILPERAPDAVAELCRLCGVERPEEIGRNGPAVGARVSAANAGEAALRLFEVVFGRDSLMVAMLVADQFPTLLDATVSHLARYQGRVYDRQREEEPGRIPHEIRDPAVDATARAITAASGWEWPYYGAVDATPLFLLAAAEAVRRRPGFLAEPGIGEAVRAAAGWLIRRLQTDPAGLLSTLPAFPGSIENQVWKDSWDSYMHADGELANGAGPVASLEVQALAHDARLAAAELLGESGYAVQAERLARTVERLFWLPGERMYALGVDHDPVSGAPRPLAVRASNQGWLLRSHLLDRHPRRAERTEAIAAAVLDERLRSARGIRTLAAGEVRYRPRAYHNGNMWPFDSYLCADGLARCGFRDEADELGAAVLAVCAETRSFPEFVAGDDALPAVATRIVDVWDDRLGRGNRVEQPPQEIVGWTVGAAIACAHRGERLV